MDYRLEQLRFQIREDPSSRIFFKLGEHLRREGELDEAVEILQRGLEEHPTYVSAWVSLGRALIDRGDSAAASPALQKALELDPENAVAARFAGEAAIANREWVEAIKALKRARAMSPQDETLDERIAEVEEELAKMGLLEAPEPVREPVPAAEAVFDMGSGENDEEEAAEADVFAGGAVEESPSPQPATEPVDQTIDEDVVFIDADEAVEVENEEVFSDAAAEQPEDDGPVFAVADEPAEVDADPVAWVDDAVAGGDFGRETLQVPLDQIPFSDVTDDEVADVIEDSDSDVADPDPDPIPDPDSVPHPASSFEEEFDPDPGEPDYEEPEPETPFETVHEPEPEPAPALLQEDLAPDEPVFEAAVEPEPEPEFEPEPEEVEAPFVAETVPLEAYVPETAAENESDREEAVDSPAEALPLPTMTLARLALEQGDSELAQDTLRSLIDRDPGNNDAIGLLESLQTTGPEEDTPNEGAGDPVDARARALRGWLEAVRLASEKLKS